MFDDKKRQFIFRCVECSSLYFVEFEDEEDLRDVQEDKITLTCPCGSESKILRN